MCMEANYLCAWNFYLAHYSNQQLHKFSLNEKKNPAKKKKKQIFPACDTWNVSHPQLFVESKMLQKAEVHREYVHGREIRPE